MKQRPPLKICRAYFRVSANSYAQAGYYADFRVFAIFPTARTPKPRKVFFTPTAGYIQARPLFDHAGEAAISPTDWRALVNRAPVDQDPLDEKPIEITDEVRAEARKLYLDWADSAERMIDEACQDWKDSIPAKLDRVQFGEATP